MGTLFWPFRFVIFILFYDWNILYMAMETKLLNLVPLNRINYIAWKVQWKMALIRDGLWNIINEMEIFPNFRTDTILHTKYLLQKYHALVTIILSVELSLLYLVRDPDDLVAAWKKLADQFPKKTWENKLVLRRRLYSIKLKEGDSVLKYIKLMMEIFKESQSSAIWLMRKIELYIS